MGDMVVFSFLHVVCTMSCLRWFGHVKYRHTETPVRHVEHIGLEDRKKRNDRPKLTWRRVVQHDLEALHIPEDLT